MKNKFLYTVVVMALGAAIGLFFAASSKGPDTGGDNKFKVAATIFPLYDIVQNVAGDSADVELLLPPGASPHFYEFTPRQLAELSGTRAIFAIGHGLDDWSLRAADSAEGAEVIVVDGGIELRESVSREHEEDEHGEEEGHEHGPVDPHYWLHFGNARIIADTVAADLARLDPDNADKYTANAEAYKIMLASEEDELKEKIAPLQQRNIVTFHDSMYYFAENFGLNIIGTFEPSAGREPTPRYLADLREEIQEHNVTVIFSEPQYSSQAFESFANDNGLSIAVMDPEGTSGESGSFMELMRYNVNTALEALE